MAIEFLNGIDLAGDLELKKADPKIILYDDSGANGTPNGEIVFSEADNTENFKLRYNGLNDRFEYWGLISGTSTLVGYWNRSTGTSLHSVGTISTGSDGNSANWKTAYDHSQATHAPTDAEANVQANWTETTTTSDAFILNKPTIPTSFNNLNAVDDRDIAPEDLTYADDFRIYFADKGQIEGGSNTNDYQDLLVLNAYTDATGGDANALAFDKNTFRILHYQADQADTNWGTAKQIAYTDQIPTDFVSAANGGTFSDSITVSGDIIGSGNLFLRSYNDTGEGIFFRDGFEEGDSNPYNLSITVLNDGDGSSDALEINAYDGIYFNTGSGSQNIRAKIDSSGTATFYGNIAVTGTVDGVDISALPTSFAPTDAEANVQADWNATSGDALILNKPTIPTVPDSYAPTDAEANVQADWTETTTTSDAFILNKPTIPTDHGDHDGLYIPVGGGTITSGTSVGLTINHNTFEKGLVLHRNHASNSASIVFKNNGGVNGTLFSLASDGAPYWQYNDSSTPNYRIHTANDFAVADVTGALPKAGGTMTGTLVMSAVNPEIHFNGTSDSGVDMAIKATPEGLDFYEPEESNKIHFQILDDTGVNAVYGYNLNGTMVISSSRVLANVTGNISMFTNDSGYLTRTTPNAPTTLTTTIVNSTINVGFTASTTTNIDYYLIFSSVGGGDYGLISVIPPTDFGATMSVIDNSFDATGTQAYRVYAVKNGVYSTALTGSQAFAVTSAEPTNMSVVNLNKAYYVQWDPPSANARFITAYNVYKHEHATQGSLDRDSATLIYSGLNTSYMYQISGANNVNYHQFWVETTIG